MNLSSACLKIWLKANTSSSHQGKFAFSMSFRGNDWQQRDFLKILVLAKQELLWRWLFRFAISKKSRGLTHQNWLTQFRFVSVIDIEQYPNSATLEQGGAGVSSFSLRSWSIHWAFWAEFWHSCAVGLLLPLTHGFNTLTPKRASGLWNIFPKSHQNFRALWQTYECIQILNSVSCTSIFFILFTWKNQTIKALNSPAS